MNNFHSYLTPKECMEHVKPAEPLDYYEALARKKRRRCCVCETENEWMLIESEMCFSCTTGESDASEDYEIVDWSK